MIWFLKRLFQKRSESQKAPYPVLKGAPARVRIKTYSADTGSVYQYVYRGYRPAEAGHEFVFELIAAGRREVGIRIADSAVAECARRIGREVLSQERYALAKMALFEAFDSGADLNSLTPGPDEMEEYLRKLGRLS